MLLRSRSVTAVKVRRDSRRQQHSLRSAKYAIYIFDVMEHAWRIRGEGNALKVALEYVEAAGRGPQRVPLEQWDRRRRHEYHVLTQVLETCNSHVEYAFPKSGYANIPDSNPAPLRNSTTIVCEAYTRDDVHITRYPTESGSTKSRRKRYSCSSVAYMNIVQDNVKRQRMPTYYRQLDD